MVSLATGHLLQLAIVALNISHRRAMSAKKAQKQVRAYHYEGGCKTWLFVLWILKTSYLFALSLYTALLPSTGDRRITVTLQVYSHQGASSCELCLCDTTMPNTLVRASLILAILLNVTTLPVAKAVLCLKDAVLFSCHNCLE